MTDEELTEKLKSIGQWITDPEPLPFPSTLPRCWEWHKRMSWALLCARLKSVGLPVPTKEGLKAAWEQVREGQGYDDACGFYLRIHRAAFGLPFKGAFESWSAIS